MTSSIDEQLEHLFHDDIKTDGDLKEALDEANPKKYTHIVSPPENARIFGILQEHYKPDPSAKDIVDYARFGGLEVVALCGYRWIPDDDPDKYDACPICMDVAGMHMRNAGE